MTMLNKCNDTTDFYLPGRPTYSRWCFYSWDWLEYAPSSEHSRFLFQKGWQALPSLERKSAYPLVFRPWKLLNRLLHLHYHFLTQFRPDLKILQWHSNKYNYKADNLPSFSFKLHRIYSSPSKNKLILTIKLIFEDISYLLYNSINIMTQSIKSILFD